MYAKYTTLITLMMISLLGCQNDDHADDSKTGLKFSIGFRATTRVETDASFKSIFENGDQIGIFIVKHPSGSTIELSPLNLYDNIPATYDADNQSINLNQPLYYPTDGDVIDAYAYYPYKALNTNPLAIIFNVDNNQNGSSYNASDLITATPVIGVLKGQTIDLAFSHLLSMIEVELPITDGYYSPTATTTVTLQNVNPKTNLDLSTNNATVDSQASTTNIIMHRVQKLGTPEYSTRYTYRALVPAQTIPAGQRLFEIETDARVFYDSRITEPLILKPSSVERQTRQLPPL